ncbi:MAG: glycosyltransferase [Thermoanaerobaculaceae bacterium]
MSTSLHGPRLLWGSPLPPTRSGIADYAAELLPHLAHHAEIRVLTPPGWSGGDTFAGLAMASIDPDPGPRATDPGFMPLLHLGNNPYHLWIAGYLRRHGGLVVLHDTVLHHLLVEEAAAGGDWARFGAELTQAHGGAGAALAEGRRWGMHGSRDPFLFPARSVLLRFARGVIVHSRQALGEVRRDCPGLPVHQVPLALGALPAGDRGAWRERLGAGERELVLTHLGFLTPAKGLDVILKAMLALRELAVPARLVVVGEGSERATLERAMAGAGLGDAIRLWGFASEADLGGILAATDVGLVPRFPTAGETSAAALRFLSAGVPVAVAGYRQFLELPSDAAFRLAPGQAGTADLVRLVAHLAGDRERAAVARAAARAAWERGGHPPPNAARCLARALGELISELA